MIDTPPQSFPEAEDGWPPLSPVRIARMRLEDIEHVSRLERRCYALPWNSSAYVTEIGNPNAYYTVAKDERDIVVGYAGMWVIMDELHITTIAVDPSHRGRKIGERLLHDLMEKGIAQQAERATLEVRERNTVAHNLYLKYNFEDVAIRKRYYSDNNENAVIMWANNLQTPEYQTMLQDFKLRLSG
jgi:ribosomal-protein-alanine N-acetyltransferase